MTLLLRFLNNKLDQAYQNDEIIALEILMSKHHRKSHYTLGCPLSQNVVRISAKSTAQSYPKYIKS